MHLSANSIPSNPDSETLTSIGNINDLEKVLPEILSLPEDEKFLTRVYGSLLRRQPDQVGLSTYLGRLKEGCPRKVVLFQIAASAEAREKNITIPMPMAVKFYAGAFRIKSRLKRIPVISTLLLWPYRLLRLPTAFYRLSKDFHVAQQRINSLQNESDRQAESIRSEMKLIAENFAAATQRLLKLDSDSRAIRDGITDLRARSVYPVINAGPHGFVLRVGDFIYRLPGDNWKMAAYMAYSGDVEPGLVRVFRSLVKEGMVVVDIGANIGAYTLMAGLQVGDSGNVYSFEPAPLTFKALKDNVEVNGLLRNDRVTLHRLAVTDRKGIARLSVYEENSLNTLYAKLNDVDFIEVETTSLDEILKDVAKIDVVKIDAEGAEPFILRGMKAIIGNNPAITIFMEFAPTHLERAGVSPGAFIDEIRAYGFSMRRIEDLSGNISEISRQELVSSFSVNLMLTRKE